MSHSIFGSLALAPVAASRRSVRSVADPEPPVLRRAIGIRASRRSLSMMCLATCRISLQSGLQLITVDEVGRVRTDAWGRQDADGRVVMDERQMIQAAQQIVDVVVGRPLAAWGVTHIATDESEE